MQAHIAPMGKLAKTDETLLAKHHGLRKVSRDRNQLCNHGGVAEWSNAPVLKTGIPQGIVGSNPTPSARAQPTTGRLGSGISGAGRKLFASAASKGSNAHTSCITMYLKSKIPEEVFWTPHRLRGAKSTHTPVRVSRTLYNQKSGGGFLQPSTA